MDLASRMAMFAFFSMFIYCSLRSSSLISKLLAGMIWKMAFRQFLKQRMFLKVSYQAVVSAKPLAVRKPGSYLFQLKPFRRIPWPYRRKSSCQSLDIRYVYQNIIYKTIFDKPSAWLLISFFFSLQLDQPPSILIIIELLLSFTFYQLIELIGMLFGRQAAQFQSKRYNQNIMCPHLPYQNDSIEDYIGTILPNKAESILPVGKGQVPLRKQQSLKENNGQNELWNLQDMWNAVEQSKETRVAKIQIQNIFDEPETLTLDQMQQIFGQQSPKVAKKEKIVQEISEQVEDLEQLWNLVDSPAKENIETVEQNVVLAQKIQKTQVVELNQKVNNYEFYQIQQKSSTSEERTCLTLGKNFVIYDQFSFMTSFFETSIYCYLGFQQTQPNHYTMYDLTTKQPLLYCSVQKYEQFGERTDKKKIEFERDYCLKFRLSKNNQLVGTVWQKNISNGLLYNLRHYNVYEKQYDDSVALIEITDGYIGNNCYCNTNVFVSQKWSVNSAQLKMKLSLKNGYLIANMGLAGIKSAPYNCRLENANNSFVYLLGSVDKDTDRFMIRVGEGISPLVAFATSVGRKRYIDSFKD